MYHKHFGLREEPFGVSPDRRFFFRTEQHAEAIATLHYAIQQRRGFVLLVGRAGSGKTNVLFTLVDLLKDRAQIAYLANPYYDRATVLQSLLECMGLQPAASAAANHRLFYEYLLMTQGAGKMCVAIFDEAQDLDRDTLEAIRMLSNFENSKGKLVQIVLGGQPRLAETLKRPDCEQIRQRINAIARLNPLTGPEVRAYMAHRLEAAGGTSAIFTHEAIQAISLASGGVPRNVNTICFNSLSLAFALDRRQVGPEEVAEVLCDLDLVADAPASAPLGASPFGGDAAVSLSPDSPAGANAGSSVLLRSAWLEKWPPEWVGVPVPPSSVPDECPAAPEAVVEAAPAPDTPTSPPPLEIPLQLVPVFTQTSRSFRAAWIACSIALLAAGAVAGKLITSLVQFRF